jgi:predicted ATPase
LIARQIASFSVDFQEDLKRWAGVEQIDDAYKDVEILKTVFKMAGSGTTRLFMMFYYNNKPSDYYFLDLPETSQHLIFRRMLVDLLTSFNQHSKFVIATHDPNVFKEEGDYQSIDLDLENKEYYPDVEIIN